MPDAPWSPLPTPAPPGSPLPWSWALTAAFAAGGLGTAFGLWRFHFGVDPFGGPGLGAATLWLQWSRVQAPLTSFSVVAALAAWRAGTPAAVPSPADVAAVVGRGLLGWPLSLGGAALVLACRLRLTGTAIDTVTRFAALDDLAAGGLHALAGALCVAALWRPWLRSSAGSSPAARGVVTWLMAGLVSASVQLLLARLLGMPIRPTE